MLFLFTKQRSKYGLIRSSIDFGREWCECLNGSFFELLYLYLWYSHMIFVLNVCVGDVRPCNLFSACVYCFHSHSSLLVGMIIKYFPISSYMCAISFCICIVCVFTLISF